MDISIITFTLGGRDTYLKTCLEASASDIFDTDNNIKIEHHVVFQGCKLPSFVFDIFAYQNLLNNYEFFIHEWPENIGIGAGLNKILPECKGELIFKMDDDCKIISQGFFDTAWTIHKKFPTSVFSPFPLGLTGNPGGPKGFKHSVWHDKSTDTIYTRRHVTHVGGFARFAPASVIKGFTFPNDLVPGISGAEDGYFSQHCNNNKIEMFYLERGLVVEHNESTPGQVIRYPEYFKCRNYENSLKTEIVE